MLVVQNQKTSQSGIHINSMPVHFVGLCMLYDIRKQLSQGSSLTPCLYILLVNVYFVQYTCKRVTEVQRSTLTSGFKTLILVGLGVLVLFSSPLKLGHFVNKINLIFISSFLC